MLRPKPPVLLGLSLRDSSGPHFSKPEPELGEKEIENLDKCSNFTQLKLHHCVQEIHQRFCDCSILNFTARREICKKFDNTGILAGNHCH